MITSRSSLISKYFYTYLTRINRFRSSGPTESQFSKDPAPLFFNKNVQHLLKVLTRVDYNRAFKARKDGAWLSPPEYTFMTEEQLKEAQSAIARRVSRRIQMPPVVKATKDTVEVISEDPALQGHDESNCIFTDISYGISNKERLIVVREPSGRLRHALRNERYRMNQVYFPMRDRELHVPRMFYDPYLKDLLEREEYEFILDRACTQFEPDDPEYHRITNEVYSEVNKKKKFDLLRSTRHFGPLAFHLAWERTIDGLLVDVLENNNIGEATALIKLYHHIHPDCASISDVTSMHGVDLVKTYAKKDSKDRNRVERAIKVYEKLKEEEEKVREGVVKAHGLDSNVSDEKNSYE